MDPLKLTCSQQLWLHSSVGRALHRYRRGHGFESRWSLNFFQASLLQLLKLRINREDLSWRHYVLYFEQFAMTLSNYLPDGYQSMHTQIVLQNITWKESTNQKVSDWGYCSKFLINAGIEARKCVKTVDFQKCSVNAWMSQNVWNSLQMHDGDHDGAETNCRIAHILGTLLMISYWFHFYFSDIIVVCAA